MKWKSYNFVGFPFFFLFCFPFKIKDILAGMVLAYNLSDFIGQARLKDASFRRA
jgi:hypothetical protein